MQTVGSIMWAGVIALFVCPVIKGFIHQHQELIYYYKAPFMEGDGNVQDLMQSTESRSAAGLLCDPRQVI